MRYFLILVTLLCPVFAGAKRPNILWITSEDNGAHWLGCYGNEQASTPRLDRLAAEGNRFLHAYSNSPVCAVARSTILTGVHAPSQGTHHMRSRHAIPGHILPDLPEVHADLAVDHDKMRRMDRRVGGILDDLEQAGLADDTIVFYYADHGGPMARGKRYLEDTGVQFSTPKPVNTSSVSRSG